MKYKLKKISAVIVFVLVTFYLYMLLIGIEIKNPRQKMVRTIIFAENEVHNEKYKKELESLVLTVELGTTHTFVSENENYNDHYSMTEPKCFAELHKNGTINFFYATSCEINGVVYQDYDYIGRTCLLSPQEYLKLFSICETIKNNGITIEENSLIKTAKRTKKMYPAEYTYGLENLPQNWESISPTARLFYKGNWYAYNDNESIGMFELKELLKKNRHIQNMIKHDIGHNTWDTSSSVYELE